MLRLIILENIKLKFLPVYIVDYWFHQQITTNSKALSLQRLAFAVIHSATNTLVMNLEIALIVSSEIIYLIVANFKVAEESLAFHLPNQEMKKRNELVQMAASEIKMHQPRSGSKLFY
jgi:hypothetical protein